MYCPKCLGDSLYLREHGVINLIINNKQMDAGRFLYNLSDQSGEELKMALSQKVEEFFKWYSNFKNREAIEIIELCTSDVFCENKCSIPLNHRLSVIDVLISRQQLAELCEDIGQKYNMSIKIKID